MNQDPLLPAAKPRDSQSDLAKALGALAMFFLGKYAAPGITAKTGIPADVAIGGLIGAGHWLKSRLKRKKGFRWL